MKGNGMDQNLDAIIIIWSTWGIVLSASLLSPFRQKRNWEIKMEWKLMMLIESSTYAWHDQSINMHITPAVVTHGATGKQYIERTRHPPQPLLKLN